MTRLLVPMLAVFFPTQSASAYNITFNDGGTTNRRHYVEDGVLPFTYEMRNITTFPYSATESTVSGSNSAESSWSLSASSFDYTHSLNQLSTEVDSIVRSFGRTYFSVDENINFAASGTYTMVGT